MITITTPVTTPTPADLASASAANTPAAASSFADQLAIFGENPSSSAAPQQNTFLQLLLGSASSTTPAAAPSTPAPVVSTAAATSTNTVAPAPNSNDAPQPAPTYTISSTPPYFTPGPDESVTVTPTNGMDPFPAVSMNSYLQKFIGQSVNNMYGFIDGTQSWANGGASAITNSFVSMVQQRLAVFPSMGEGIDPVAMGTQYANALMNVLSNVPVSHFGATDFTGSVMDFLNQGGSPAPTVLNQTPTVMNAVNA